LWCLAFPWVFHHIESLVRDWSFAPPLIIIAQGLLCCAFLIGLPTICMGGTIPFLTVGLSRSLGEATRVHARVYAINTAGAFVGTLLAGFYLVPTFGLPVTVKGTAVVNCLAGLFFLLLSTRRTRRAEDEPLPQAETSQEKTPRQGSGRSHTPPTLYAVAFLSGFYVMTLENVLIRITNLSLGSSSYSFSLIVAAFILAIAIGSHLVGRRQQWPLTLLFVNQLGIAVLLLLVYLTLDGWPYWAHLLRISFQDNIAGFWAYYAAAFLVLLTVLVVPVGLMGATVPITFHEVKRDLSHVGRHSGLLFSCNTLGNLTGSLVGGIVLYYFLNNNGVFLTALILAAVSATLAARPLGRGWLALGAVVAVLVPAIGLLPGAYDKSRFMIGTFLLRQPEEASFAGPSGFFQTFFKYEKLHFYRDGVSNTVAVTSPLDEEGREVFSRSIMVNGKSDSSTRWDIHTLKLLAHLPTLFCRQEPKTAMVVGLGTGVTAGELSLHKGLERIEMLRGTRAASDRHRRWRRAIAPPSRPAAPPAGRNASESRFDPRGSQPDSRFTGDPNHGVRFVGGNDQVDLLVAQPIGQGHPKPESAFQAHPTGKDQQIDIPSPSAVIRTGSKEIGGRTRSASPGLLADRRPLCLGQPHEDHSIPDPPGRNPDSPSRNTPPNASERTGSTRQRSHADSLPSAAASTGNRAPSEGGGANTSPRTHIRPGASSMVRNDDEARSGLPSGRAGSPALPAASVESETLPRPSPVHASTTSAGL